MITRASGYLRLSDDPAPPATEELQRDGYTLLAGVLSAGEVAAVAAEIDRVFDELPADERVATRRPGHYEPFRYEMLNRSARCQEVIGHPSVLEVIEPLLGEDCHVIANTAWRQPPEESDHGGRFWHIDSGPHIPRDPSVPWDERIPYPVFAIAAHIFLLDCPLEAGPTGVVPGSHMSGQSPPARDEDDLTYQGRGVVPMLARAGDVALFVSDVWHRRLPPGPGDPGRYFLQCHYGRRDLAQRLRPTAVAHQLSDEAIERATTSRQQTLIGLHKPFFYDA